MKRLMIVSVAGLALLSGCGSATEPKDGSRSQYITVERIDMGNNQTVTCVIFKSVNEGGISCDWQGMWEVGS